MVFTCRGCYLEKQSLQASGCTRLREMWPLKLLPTLVPSPILTHRLPGPVQQQPTRQGRLRRKRLAGWFATLKPGGHGFTLPNWPTAQ